MSYDDLNQAAADAAVAMLRRHAPEEAEVVEPYVSKLFAALQEGHSYIWLEEHEARSLQRAQSVVGSSGDTPLILAGRKLFLGRIWQLERDLAAEIVRLAGAAVPPVDWLQAGRNLEAWFGLEGSNGQRDAAALALLKPFMLISGGPGTGKTTTVAKLLGLLCGHAGKLPRIALAAPTGKAAAHMARALHKALATFDLPDAVRNHLLQLEGQTVHRLLKLRPPQMLPLFDRDQPLPLDILIIDEASMLDIALLLQLLQAVPSGCRVVLLGDENQLPSVGAGAVLSELAQKTVLTAETAQELEAMLPQHGFTVAEHAPLLAENVARLQVSHRFGDDSGIGCLARAVAAENADEAWAQFARFPDVLEVKAGSGKQQAEELYRCQQRYWQAVDAGDVAAAFQHQGDAVVLAARRDDAQAFNEEYRRCLQRHGRARADAPWFAGQVVMVSRNDYALDVFNGDIGLILPDDEQQDVLAAYFPVAGSYRKIALSRLPVHETAFAMTVHKSQGSEYHEVWLLPPRQAEAGNAHGLNKALLYTAITRARERFVFWGGKEVFQTACTLNERRRSALREMIQSNGLLAG
ncbi:recombinase D [Neisseria zoodegmatis]|uniref:RecBCD enzyme subunit RecD n=1 Tax=Neisseria zoodegmatis TaxID=326523 RepID=A0A378WE69_9NEIS|nr:exodeoxyribonuclease V subunit alpha [Neisseria zoodegmatis]SUA35748.1 recombinase D [Neisseria zoodegmatis]